MSFSSGDGYNACNGDGFNNYRYSTGSIGSTVKPFGSGLYSRRLEHCGQQTHTIPEQNLKNEVNASNMCEFPCEFELNDVSKVNIGYDNDEAFRYRSDRSVQPQASRNRLERSVQPPTRTSSPESNTRNVYCVFFVFFLI